MNPESDQLYYLKKHKAYEVDFVVVRSGRIDELIQVSYDFSNPSQKLYKREIGGLVKGSESVKCDNLTLIIMEGTPEVKNGGRQKNQNRKGLRLAFRLRMIIQSDLK